MLRCQASSPILPVGHTGRARFSKESHASRPRGAHLDDLASLWVKLLDRLRPRVVPPTGQALHVAHVLVSVHVIRQAVHQANVRPVSRVLERSRERREEEAGRTKRTPRAQQKKTAQKILKHTVVTERLKHNKQHQYVLNPQERKKKETESACAQKDQTCSGRFRMH